MKTNTIISCQKSEQSPLQRKGLGLKLKGRSIYNYFAVDRDKSIILIIVLIFPINSNIYLLTPDYFFPYYETLDSFVFTISESVGHILLASALYFSFEKRDNFYQYLPFSIILFCCYHIFAKIPFWSEVPVYVELFSFLLVGVPFICLIRFVKNKVIADKMRKINHGILQNTSRLKGLLGIKFEDESLRLALMCKEVNEAHQKAIDMSNGLKMEEVE